MDFDDFLSINKNFFRKRNSPEHIKESKKNVVKEYSSSSEASASSSGEEEEDKVEYEDIPLTEKEKNEISAKILRAELMGNDVCMNYIISGCC